MTRTTPPPPTDSLPCQLDPERWFDRHHHADALAACLDCPARRWCAGEALQCRASWGLWAGVWIGGQHDDALPYLNAVAIGALTESSAVIENYEKNSRVDDSQSAPLSLPRPEGSWRASSARTAVLARSSGHCEVFAQGCRYTDDQLVSRRSAALSSESATPPVLFAACDNCADMVAALDPKLAASFGYVITGRRRDPAQVPFYWRQAQWVLFDRDGWLTELTDNAQTA